MFLVQVLEGLLWSKIRRVGQDTSLSYVHLGVLGLGWWALGPWP